MGMRKITEFLHNKKFVLVEQNIEKGYMNLAGMTYAAENTTIGTICYNTEDGVRPVPAEDMPEIIGGIIRMVTPGYRLPGSGPGLAPTEGRKMTEFLYKKKFVLMEEDTYDSFLRKWRPLGYNTKNGVEPIPKQEMPKVMVEIAKMLVRDNGHMINILNAL